jgi:hypothetical protein
MQRQEIPNNTIEQVKEYLRDALTVTASINPPKELREAVFVAAVNLIASKQIVMQQPQPLAFTPIGPKAGGYS